MVKGKGIAVGLIFLIVPIYAWIINYKGLGDAALMFLEGGIMWMLILIGAISLLIGLSDLKSN